MVVPVAVVVDVAGNLCFPRRHHGVQRPWPGGHARLSRLPRGLPCGAAVDQGVEVTAQGAAKGGAAAVDALQADVRAVDHRVARRAVTGPRTGVAGRPIRQVAAALCAVALSRSAAVVGPGPARGRGAGGRVLGGAAEVAQPPARRVGAWGHCQALGLAQSPGMCGSGLAVVPCAHNWLLGGEEGAGPAGPSHRAPGRAQQVGGGQVVVRVAGVLANEVEPPARFLVGSRGSQGLRKRISLYDVEHAEGASAMLMQPGVHTGTMELMEAGNDPELLALGELLQADGAHRGGAAAAPGVWPLIPGAPAAGPVTPGGQLADGPGCSLLKGVLGRTVGQDGAKAPLPTPLDPGLCSGPRHAVRSHDHQTTRGVCTLGVLPRPCKHFIPFPHAYYYLSFP